MSRPVRIGLIGAGGNTRARHIPGFQAIPGVELAAVCNRTRASAERVAREAGIPRVEDSWESIVADPAIDAICIGTWPDLHARLTIAALRAGKHVLTEARMASNLAEAEAMLEASRRCSGLVAQIVPAPMSLPFDATVTAALQSGSLGSLREILVAATSDTLADPAQPLSWRQDTARNGRNTLQMGIYYEMVLRWLDRGVVSVAADAAIFTPRRPASEGTEGITTVPESLTVLGRFADGARLVAHFSGVETTPARAEVRLNGTEGGLRLDLLRGELWETRRGATEKPLVPVPEARGAWRVEADFIDSIRDGRPVRLTDFETGVRYMRFTEAVWESWNGDGRRVALPER